MLAVAACAGRPAREQPLPSSATLAAHGIECHKERATGSLVAATVCTSAAERAREAENTQKVKDQMNNVPAGPCVPTGPCQ